MISDLLLNFRHLEGLQLRNLAPVNIIVGPNNVGKTTLFKGIQTFAQAAGEQVKVEHAQELMIGTPASPEAQVKLRAAKFAAGITYFWSHHKKGGTEAVWSDDQDRAFKAVQATASIMPGSYHTGQLKIPEIQWVERGRGSDISLMKATEQHLSGSHKAWLKSSYFLWHRRKSFYVEQLGAYHERLDSEAEHLTGRLDHILSSMAGGKLRGRIDQFMNSVIPGIGKIGIHREKNTSATDISVAFDDGETTRGLKDLGGGVEQVLALALVLLAEPDEGAVFLEEPESHLHESAQRRLIKQIELHRGKRQVFLATHSPIFVNEFSGANVYRLTSNPKPKRTTAHPCLSKPEQRQVLDELGVLPSSLTQTNCVIWVEGPTEVRLVTHWLGLVAPELLVNQHYTFAQTGGSNILSLAADIAPDPEAWIQDINRICRHNYFICDRDAGIGQIPAKEPVRDIGKLVGDNHWITHGYEIEWYLPNEAIEHLWDVAAAEHVRARRGTADLPFYDHLKASKSRGTGTAGERKTAYAERVVKKALSTETWFAGPAGEDLQTQLERLVAFIRHANQLEAPSSKTCATCERPLP
ncbi:AAA family ATPase [Nannocystis sp. ILAH1]|uniref:AAA family ATPase n=1 Tax=unclassified Nannocystis TaxID=2627009 RepID=UPI002270B809|nr:MULTISPECIES: AAA family ATPase [unclassified Nannocystis]MCY0988525.1 AAA family ATPase [Nannocystis sp. ILAH1]MCY1067513.1 AAA family ATPase [Nannocystis sp. RBIL2]